MQGVNLIGDAKNFTVANETFTAKDTADDTIVAFTPTSRYVMGNEIDQYVWRALGTIAGSDDNIGTGEGQ